MQQDKKKLQLSELEEIYLDAYENTNLYKESTKKMAKQVH